MRACRRSSGRPEYAPVPFRRGLARELRPIINFMVSTTGLVIKRATGRETDPRKVIANVFNMFCDFLRNENYVYVITELGSFAL